MRSFIDHPVDPRKITASQRFVGLEAQTPNAIENRRGQIHVEKILGIVVEVLRFVIVERSLRANLNRREGFAAENPDGQFRPLDILLNQALAVAIGEAPQLLKVNESGEFKRGTIAESKESYRIETYGRVVGITRQVLINDDLDAFTRIPAMYGTAIATLESDVVWAIVTANAAMADGVALFHATHKNLAASGAALSVTTVGDGRAAMAKQTGLDKKTVLNIRPSFLIVPAALELAAEQLIAQNLVPAKTGDVVPQSIRTLSPISEPRLDNASATAWYLAANPAQIDTIEYAYLEGQQGAYIETRNGFDVDGVEIKCRLDFGAKAIDWRGLYKNAGA